MSDPKKSNTPESTFTIDNEFTDEMPSVTRLLNRKSLKLPDPYSNTEEIPKPPVTTPPQKPRSFPAALPNSPPRFPAPP